MPSTKDMLNEKSGMFENFQLSSFVGAWTSFLMRK
jgi:hypothetical protein